MSKKVFIFAVILVLAVLGGWWLLFRGQRGVQNAPKQPLVASEQPVQPPQTVENPAKPPEIQATIDPDVNHWQTKETEFFTIKFPKEWYWLEPDPKKTEYRSEVITNNPNFPIDKYPDISVFTGSDYQLLSSNKKYQSLPLNSSEVVITTNRLGAATSDSGTPREFMEGEIARLKKGLYPEMKCRYTSNLASVPLTAFCSFLDSNGQIVDTYYVSHTKRTFAYTARISQENSIKEGMEHILEQIAKSMVQKKDF